MFFKTRNVELYYEKTGEGEPLILLHGNGESHEIFNEAIEVLKRKFTVYAIDTRGHGQSSPVLEIHYDDIAHDVYRFIKRFDAILDMDLPFHKIGMAHLCGGVITESSAVPESEYRRIFAKAADRGVGIEINLRLEPMTGEHKDAVMAPLFIAKEAGCKFYLGSDIHHPHNMPDVMDRFNTAIDILDLREEDKFIIGK